MILLQQGQGAGSLQVISSSSLTSSSSFIVLTEVSSLSDSPGAGPNRLKYLVAGETLRSALFCLFDFSLSSSSLSSASYSVSTIKQLIMLTSSFSSYILDKASA